MRKVRSSSRWLSIILLVAITGCLEKDEGCLDPNALNLDVTADVNANCTYPNLRFNVSHRWIDQDTSIFRLNDMLELPDGDMVLFSEFQFFISSISLGDNPVIHVFDSIQLEDQSFIRDDLTLITPVSFQFVTGHVNEFGSYDGLKFAVGYSDEWNHVDTSYAQEIERNHPWLDQSMRSDENNRYACKLSYTLFGQDTVTREIGMELASPAQVEKSSVFQFPQANHADVGLFIDYHTLLLGANLRDDSDEKIKDLFLTNINDAIEIVQ